MYLNVLTLVLILLPSPPPPSSLPHLLFLLTLSSFSHSCFPYIFFSFVLHLSFRRLHHFIFSVFCCWFPLSTLSSCLLLVLVLLLLPLVLRLLFLLFLFLLFTIVITNTAQEEGARCGGSYRLGKHEEHFHFLISEDLLSKHGRPAPHSSPGDTPLRA